LVDLQINFHWVTNNIKKQGLQIYGVELQTYEIVNSLAGAQVIVAVAGPEDQEEIKGYLENRSAYFFC